VDGGFRTRNDFECISVSLHEVEHRIQICFNGVTWSCLDHTDKDFWTRRDDALVRKQIIKMLYDKHNGHHLSVAYAKLCWDTTQQIISDNVDQGMTIGEAWRNSIAYQAKWLNPPTSKGGGAASGEQGDKSSKGRGRKRKGDGPPDPESPAEKQRRKAQSERDIARNKDYYSGGKKGKSKGKGKGKNDDPWNQWPKNNAASDDTWDKDWKTNKENWW
jgi:hypothetical protein